MTSDNASNVVMIVNLLSTYLLHSTLLLGAAALVVWCCRPQSHTLVERLWKSAAVIPLLTAPLQLLCGVGNPVFSPRWTGTPTQEPVEIYEPQTAAETLSVGNEQPANDPPSWRLQDAESSDALTAEDAKAAQVVLMPPSTGDTTDVSPRNPTETAPATNSVSVVDPPASIANASPASGRFLSWFAALAVGIATVGALRFTAAGLWFRRRHRKLREVESSVVRGALTRVARRARVRRRVRLLEAEHLSEPVAFGAWRWTIVVPRDIEMRLDGPELEALMRHELAHLVRGDAWWLLFGRLLCACLPFQPLNFLARARWRQAAEFQCDDWAAERTHDRLTLARCLTRVAEWRLNATDCAHALGAGGSESTLSRRVQRLLAERPPDDLWSRSQGRRMLTALTLIVVAVVCWCGPRTMLLAQFDDQRDEPTPERSNSLNTKTDAESLAKEIHSLNVELRQLERDLRKVDILLHSRDSPPVVRTVAVRLASRLSNLRRQRRELLARAGLP